MMDARNRDYAEGYGQCRGDLLLRIDEAIRFVIDYMPEDATPRLSELRRVRALVKAMRPAR
jgi:hypothetical protein